VNLPMGFPDAVLMSDRTDVRLVNSIWCTRCHGPCWGLSVAALVSRGAESASRVSGPFNHLTLPEALSYALLILGTIADGVDRVLERDRLEVSGQTQLPLYAD